MPSTIDERITGQTSKAEMQLGLARAWLASADSSAGTEEDPRATTDGIPPERLALAGAGIRHLSSIAQELVELWNGPEEDDYGTLRPTKYAFDESIRLLVDAAIVAALRGRQIPLASVSTDSNGGVRVEWVRAEVGVRLVVPAANEAPAYIYFEVGNDYATEEATPERLARWLLEIE